MTSHALRPFGAAADGEPWAEAGVSHIGSESWAGLVETVLGGRTFAIAFVPRYSATEGIADDRAGGFRFGFVSARDGAAVAAGVGLAPDLMLASRASRAALDSCSTRIIGRSGD